MKGTRFVHTSIRWTGVALAGALLICGWAPDAGAYFPRGGFDIFSVPRYAVWPLNDFDTNNDGDIGPDEGLEIWIESGENGFYEEELVQIENAFQVWEDVPTSYVAFRVTAYPQDPLAGVSRPDYITLISMQEGSSVLDTGEGEGEEQVVTEGEGEEEAKQIAPGVSITVYEVDGFVFATSLPLYAIEDTAIDSAGASVIVSAGTMQQSEIIVDSFLVRPSELGIDSYLSIESVLIHELGVVLGLGPTPLNNLRSLTDTDDLYDLLLENKSLWMTGSDGVGRYVGITPTMFPSPFFVENDDGTYSEGWRDLAPDDISGISWLYPRGSQNNFFNIVHNARSHTREGTGLPSVPIPGAHVVAWADVDNNPSTPRLPLFSTMTGLYEPSQNEQLVGTFDLKGMWKKLEEPGSDGIQFTPEYVLTLCPLNETGLQRQAPAGAAPLAFDSMQGSLSYSVSQRSAADYQSGYPSEVFHEVENLIDVSNREAGTPLVWDYVANTVVSADTGNAIPTILRNNKPMFGDPNNVCPLNVIENTLTGTTTTTTTDVTSVVTSGDVDITDVAGLLGIKNIGGGNGGGPGGPSGPNALRAFRDQVLLESAAGTALVNLYYRMAPSIAGFLIDHNTARRVFRACVYFGYSLLEEFNMLHILLAGGAALLVFIRRRRSHKVTATLLLILMALFLLMQPAQAGILYVTTEDLTEKADAIITGEVIATECYWEDGNRIYTDVTLMVSDSVKGSFNKSSFMTFPVIGGYKNGFMMRSPDIPTFTEGEEVLLYMRELEDNTYVMLAGARGKFNIVESTSEDNKSQKYVTCGADINRLILNQDSEAIEKSGEKSDVAKKEKKGELIELEAYLDYLRGIVREQKREKD